MTTTSLSLAAERSTLDSVRAARNPIEDALSIIVIAACALILHRDALTGGPAFYELDTRLFYYPLASWAHQQLHSGNFPLWLPGIFTGYPIFADGELGLAYVPQLALLAFLPASIAMVWLRVLHVFLAGVFCFVFLRGMRLHPVSALGGALIFAFGSFLTAQMHHENVVRSAVWLPVVLFCLARGGRRWTALGALAFAQSALGLHVQPVMMAGLAIALYALFSALFLTRDRLRPLISAIAIFTGGMAVAAVQWLPLGEWALVSSRRGGVDYVFASAFALPPVNLIALIFPFFFRLSDATSWWSLWQQWEIELYVGIPTLALMLVGIVFSRRAERAYFVVLGLVALWLAFAEYAPLVNLHQVLWAVPGFSYLRAPGRFSYLVVFASACLAAFGLQTLEQRRQRLKVALTGALSTLALLVGLLALLSFGRAWLLADPARAISWVEATYLAQRAQYPIDPPLVLSGLLTSLEVTTVKTGWSLALLAVTAAGFAAWYLLGFARHLLGQAIFVTLLAVDLLIFAGDFHPRIPLDRLRPELAAAAPGQRVLMHDSADLPAFEPDQLLASGIEGADGYSSLPSQRHLEMQADTSLDPRLFDLWSAPLILEPARPADMHVVNGVPFRADHPLMAGFGGSPSQVFNMPSGITSLATLRVIGTLSYAFDVPQGQMVATLAVGGQTMPIRAGVELAERAYDRPSLAGLVQHQKARAAFDFEESTPEGEDYTAHLYEADFELAPSPAASSLSITPTNPAVEVQVYGLAAIDAGGAAHPLDLASRDGLQRIDERSIADTRALPRAFVLPTAQAFSPARHPGLTATQLVASPDMDPRTMVLIENDPNAPEAPSGSQPVVPATRVDDLGPNVVRVSASASVPSYLVLDDFYHRGWTATVDGQPTRVFIANALFRAVAIDAGTHVVEFRFQPLSHIVGAAISAISLIVVLGVIAFGGRRRRSL